MRDSGILSTENSQENQSCVVLEFKLRCLCVVDIRCLYLYLLMTHEIELKSHSKTGCTRITLVGK